MTNAIRCEASDGHVQVGRGYLVARHRPTGRLGAIAAVVTSSTTCLVDLLGRIVHRIRCIAPVVLGLGCQSTNDVAAILPPASAGARAPSPVVEPAPDTGPRQLAQFTITFYYVIGEDEVAAPAEVAAPPDVAANDNRDPDDSDGSTELTAITSDLVTLYAGGGKCEPIVEVSKEFASQLTVQGTGKLHDGRVLNIFGACNCKHTPCFKVTQAPWGTAGSGKPLQPFRTVAVDPRVVKLGSLLYVPLLEGRTMPGRTPWGGYTHDGCVVADDTGGHINGTRIDLFVGRKAYFLGLSGSGGSHAWARHVPVFDGSQICERKGRRVGRKAASI